MEDNLAPEVQLAQDAPRRRVVNGRPVETHAERTLQRDATTKAAFNETSDAVLESAKLNPAVKELIQRCLDGSEPMAEDEQKSWHQQRFTPEHVNAVLLKAAGFRNREICQALQFTPTQVSVIVNHPYARKIIGLVVPENAPRVLDIRTRMEAYASEVLDHVVNLSLACDDVDKARQVGFGLLDRIGHGPIQKSVGAQVPASALGLDGKGGGNPHLLGRLAGALEESNRLDREVMPTWTPRLPPAEGALPGGVENGLDGEEEETTLSREEGP